MQRRRKIGLGCLGLLLASGLGLWLARDLPRRALAAVLSDRLAARIHIDQLEILAIDRFRLTGLKVTDLRDYPFVDALRFDQLVVEGSIFGMLDNRFDRLTLRGADVHLAPAPAPAPATEPPGRPPVIGELILEPASIRLAGGEQTEHGAGGEQTEHGAGGEQTEHGAGGPGREDLVLCVEAVVRDVGPTEGLNRKVEGSAPTFGAAEVRLSAPELDLQPLYALASTTPPELEARATNVVAELITGPGGDRLTASAERASLAAGGRHLELQQLDLLADRFGPVTSIHLGAAGAAAQLAGRLATLAQPSAEATITTAEDGAWRVEIVPRLTWLADGHLAADWDPARERLLGFEARLRGLEVERLLPDSGLAATAGAVLRAAGDRLDYRLEMVVAELALGGDRELTGIEGSTFHATGSLPFEPLAALRPPVWDGPVEATIEAPTGRGRWGALRLPPAAFPLAASFNGRWLGDQGHRLSGEYRLDSAAAGRLAASGEVAVHGSEASAELTWAWTGIDLERLLRLLREAGLPLPVFELTGNGEARGRLRRPIGAQPAIRGELHLERLEAAGETAAGRVRLNGGESTVSASWPGKGPIKISRLDASGTLAAPGTLPLDLKLEAAGRLDLDLANGRLEGNLQETQGAGLGSADFSGGWRRRSDGRAAGATISGTEVSASLSLAALDLGRWQRVAESLARADALADYELRGIAGADLEGTLADGAWNLAGPVRLESAGFASLDGSRVTEGLDSRFDIAVHGATEAPIEAQAKGHLGGFLLLWNTFFGDFSKVEASLDAHARVEPVAGGHRRWRLEVAGTLPGGPVVEAALEDRDDGWRYTLSLDDTDLAATHERYLAPLLEEQLGRFELGGKLSARVHGNFRTRGPPAWSLIGGVQIQDLSAASGGGQAAIAGLDLDLPLHLRRPARGGQTEQRDGGGQTPGSPGSELELSGPRLAGRLAFERLAVRGLELPPTESDLAVEADSVGLEKPVGLSVLGGTVTLERLTLRELLRSSRHLESSIDLSGIRLERLADELELIPLEGALNGRLSGVRLSPTLLSVDGGGTIEAFGGTVEVRDISGQDVLSRFPELRLSADFRDLDLGALTRRLDFGEMTGILQGTVEDLELFRGVPVRFFARLETTHREGTPRTVDVKAVNNITILGTGQRASVLDRGIQRFFDRYTYARLGVTMRLDNDVLLLHGLEHRGNKELFLRGRLPFRIDVVNAQPGKTVSFQTMVKRLKSLDFARATTEP